MDTLCNDCINEIFIHLEYNDILRVSQLSKSLNTQSKKENIWKKYLELNFTEYLKMNTYFETFAFNYKLNELRFSVKFKLNNFYRARELCIIRNYKNKIG